MPIMQGSQKGGAGKITVLSVAPLLGEAIRRIHYEQSISSLFDGLSG